MTDEEKGLVALTKTGIKEVSPVFEISNAYLPFNNVNELNEWYVNALEGAVKGAITLFIRYGALNAGDNHKRLRGEIEKMIEPLGEVYRLVYMSLAREEPDKVITPREVIERCNYLF